jgi:hypothetical protein
MKKMFVIAVFLISGLFYTGEAKNPNPVGFEFGFFYSSLSPYGKWIQIDAGLVAWRPTIIRRGWAPYMHGRWIWTVDGWYWDSYEPFGHIVFHYGRWYYDDYYGWIWIPDYEWAPAWVEWRYDDYYIGWAPLPPYATFSIHIGIHYTHKYYLPYSHWHFVRYRYFCDPYVYNHYVAPKHKYRIYSNARHQINYAYRDGRVVNHGVDVKYVRERTGQDIKVRDIIRTSDYREVEKSRGSNTEKVRTFVASRDQIRSDVKNIRIEKADRKSTLETSRISLGRTDAIRNDVQRNDSRETTSGRNEREVNVKKEETKRHEVKVNERTGSSQRTNVSTERKQQEPVNVPKRTERNDSNIRNEVKKNETGKVENRNNTGIIQKQNTNRTEVKSERNTNPPVNRQTEVKRNNSQNNNNNNVRIERNTQKNEVKVERKTDSSVSNKNEVKRNDTRSTQNQRNTGNNVSKERKR